jgi:hypothetical protein
MGEISPQSDLDAEATAWSEQWATLFGIAGELVTAADAVMEAMRGDLGLPRGATREQAAPIIRERIDEYMRSRRALIAYAREWEAVLDGA